MYLLAERGQPVTDAAAYADIIYSDAEQKLAADECRVLR
jgi:hypothetical protein